MNIIMFYLISVTILTVLAGIVGLNFLRYRFKGDKTIIFLIIFAVAFGVNVFTTFGLFDYSVISPLGANESASDF
ncbi:MAG: hypothetical protein K0S20_421 [Patescibacteria group bacterium]|jgi:hypothetical protein|nr:hypothetical protein [Patescibacteria group bacterium]